MLKNIPKILSPELLKVLDVYKRQDTVWKNAKKIQEYI